MSAEPRQADEQGLYARALERGTRAGLAVLVLSFAAYAGGWWPAQVTPQQLVGLWQWPVARYLEAAGLHAGWGWLSHLDRPDAAALGGVALLCAASLPGLLLLSLRFWRRGERLLAAVCAAEVVVMLLAAAGVAGRGH